MASHTKYNEALLHWIWQNRHMKSMCTSAAGKAVAILDPGRLNPSDGPDFTNAQIAIGNLTFHGDVEIHWSARDWSNHGHQTDINYNRVIMHVVFDETAGTPCSVYRPDGTSIPTLCLRPFLSKPLQLFFEKFKQSAALPCSGNLSYISPQAFEQQIANAHKQYFEQKVNDLLHFYDPNLPVSKAWQKLITIALFNGLGIAHNRTPMQQLGETLFDECPHVSSKSELISLGLKKAGIKPAKPNATYRWKHKGSRPNNHPQHRIMQGCELLWIIQNSPFKEWLRTNIDQSFNQCLQAVESKRGIGKTRAGILFGMVWLPGMYILGDLLCSKELTSSAYKAWANHRTALPTSITKPFREAGIPPSFFRQKLGAVHQLRAYCRPHNCQDCKVFKNVISS